MFVLEFQRALKFGAKVRLLRGKECIKIRQNVSQNKTKMHLDNICYICYICYIENE